MQEMIARVKSLRDYMEELMPDRRRETLSDVMEKKKEYGLVWFLAVSRGLGDLSSPTRD